MCLSNLHWYAASHGLICYTNTDLEYEHNIFLWNPTIRIIKIILDHLQRVSGTLWITIAFGLSQKT